MTLVHVTVMQALTFTVKFLNFRTPEIFAVIHLKFKQKRPNLKVFCQKHANGIANSEDPDLTDPLGAVLQPRKWQFSNPGVSNISVPVVKKGKLTFPVQYV